MDNERCRIVLFERIDKENDQPFSNGFLLPGAADFLLKHSLSIPMKEEILFSRSLKSNTFLCPFLF